MDLIFVAVQHALLYSNKNVCVCVAGEVYKKSKINTLLWIAMIVIHHIDMEYNDTYVYVLIYFCIYLLSVKIKKRLQKT